MTYYLLKNGEAFKLWLRAANLIRLSHYYEVEYNNFNSALSVSGLWEYLFIVKTIIISFH